MPDGGVAEVRGAGAGSGDGAVAVAGLRRQTAALYGRHAAFKAILIYNEQVRLYRVSIQVVSHLLLTS